MFSVSKRIFASSVQACRTQSRRTWDLVVAIGGHGILWRFPFFLLLLLLLLRLLRIGINSKHLEHDNQFRVRDLQADCVPRADLDVAHHWIIRGAPMVLPVLCSWPACGEEIERLVTGANHIHTIVGGL